MKRRIVIFFLGFIVMYTQVSGQTWNGSVSSDWNTATNWTPATVPGSGSNVTINNTALSNQLALSGDVGIASIDMSYGILNLNGFTIACTGAARFTGDSLLNGKIVAASFSNVANMRMGGKIIFDKTGAVNNFWDGNNKVYNDSLVVIWRSGTLHLESTGPDSIFSHFKVQIANVSTVSFAENFLLYVEKDLIIDNSGNGTFSWNSTISNVIGGNLVAINFSGTTTSLLLKNITTLGNNANGPFFCNTGSITGCNFSGNFTLTGSPSLTFSVSNSSFLGVNNLIQSGSLDIQGCKFGQIASGLTILRGEHNIAANVFMREGSNKFFGDVQYETNATLPGGTTLQHTFYGQDTCLGNMSFILKGNSALTSNGIGNSYVAGNVVIDGQGARKQVQFSGGAGVSFTVGGNFTATNFTPLSVPGVGITNVFLRNITALGTGDCGTFYCYTGDIQNSSFNGNMNVIGDSSQVFSLNNVVLGGDNNLIRAGNFEIQNSRFGKTVNGTTILSASHNIAANVFVREGNNKFLGNVEYETFATLPGGTTFQQTYYGKDTCLGNMSFILKGNSALTTNGLGNSYVAGNVIIDGQGARKQVVFTGGAGVSFTVGGNFTATNFTPLSVPGVGNTNVFLRNITALGTGDCGTFYCYTGDIQNSSFNGNMRVIGDSAQTYTLNNGSFLGADNLFQSGSLEIQNSRFGQTAIGITVLRAAHNVAGNVFMRDGNNKFLGDLQWEGYTITGSLLIQQTFYGQDSCFGNLTMNLSGVTSANLAGNNLYLAKGLSLNNNGTGVMVHNTGASAIRFIGTDTASYLYSGSGSVPSILNIEMNRRGGLRLQSPLTYTGTLQLTRGIILSSDLNPLNIPNGANVVSAWDSSHVDGPVNKTGNTAFVFPLGKNNVYAPISITAPALVSDVFNARYFHTPPQSAGYDTTQRDLSLNHLSRIEYWLLNRTNGSASVKVDLSWKSTRSGVVDALADLRVARWDGTAWRDEGIGGTTGNNNEGTIQTLNAVSSFSPFTLASITLNNAFPVKFTMFTATLQSNRSILLKWQTAWEKDNAFFEVQKSMDGRTWTRLSIVQPTKNMDYTYVDYEAGNGTNYYRIRQVDSDGMYTYTEVKMVMLAADNNFLVWPNPASSVLMVQTGKANGILEITDMNGRIVYTEKITNAVMSVPVQQLRTGQYVIMIRQNGELYTRRFIKQ